MGTFPAGFLWGAATASYQIEGSPLADGAGPSIWHRFTHTPGTIDRGETGDVACDHYVRYREDVALMRELGLTAYRFSIAWPRVFPEGRGRLNGPGLDFYDRLVDELLAAGITPMPTLYHWDLPAALQDLGGWANRDCASWFADYAGAVFARLGDRVKHWMTLNEPFVTAHLGYLLGRHPPGIRDLGAELRSVHHQLLGHGQAVEAYRAAGDGAIGIALSLSPQRPASDAPADREAAMRMGLYLNDLFLDPIYGKGYPSPLLEYLEGRFGQGGPPLEAGDLERISRPIDFLGVNYYQDSVIRHAPGAGLLEAEAVPGEGPRTAIGWQVRPDGLFDLLTWLRERYGSPAIYITENGAAFEDEVGADGSVEDADRLDYLRVHVDAAERAVATGVDLRGYLVWSLIDNFEWALGYKPRFGLIRVDYDSGRRTIKSSGRWWSRVIGANGLPD